MQLLMQKRIVSRAETQGRWGGTESSCALLCASASLRALIWFRPKAGLRPSGFICGWAAVVGSPLKICGNLRWSFGSAQDGVCGWKALSHTKPRRHEGKRLLPERFSWCSLCLCVSPLRPDRRSSAVEEQLSVLS